MCGASCRMPSAAPGRGVACTQCTIVAQCRPGFISDAHGPNLRADRLRKTSHHRQGRGSEGLEARVVSVRGALSAPGRHGAGHVAPLRVWTGREGRSPIVPPTPLRFDAMCCELSQDRGDGPKQKTPPRSPVNGAQRRSSCRYVCPREDSNLHGLNGHMALNHARLPIPPLGHAKCEVWNWEPGVVFLPLGSTIRTQGSDPGRIRTCDSRIKSPLLCQAELRGQFAVEAPLCMPPVGICSSWGA